jgi:hypothetical protein
MSSWNLVPDFISVEDGMLLSQAFEEHLVALRGAFGREATFGYFCLVAWGFVLCFEMIGVSSFVRCFALTPEPFYYCLLRFFHSSAFAPSTLALLWMTHVLKVAPVYRVRGRFVLFGDGTKIPKEGRRMPGVKRLHQESECNSKKEFIFGHFFHGVALAVHGLGSLVAIPVRMVMHDGFDAHLKGEHASTLVERMACVMVTLASVGEGNAYFCADAYYACRYFMELAVHHGHHLITRVRNNVVARRAAGPAQPGRRGRPRKYGDKVKLAKLFDDREQFSKVSVEHGEKVLPHECRVERLLWRGVQVLFVLTINEKGERFILLTTDTSLTAKEVVEIYLCRFQIELSFRWLVQVLSSFAYRFWMKTYPKEQRQAGNFNLAEATEKMRRSIARKVHAYESFVMVATVALGSLLLVALAHSKQVWKEFPLWFRTLPGAEHMPSALVVKYTLQQEVSEILIKSPESLMLGKILRQHSPLEEPDHPMQYKRRAA